jgi:glycolate oxidase iron-sulfur subunit
MQTIIAPHLANDQRVIKAEKTLRKCVHCGFCLATCPTYNLLGDELDSPRGRIYLIKQVVEGATPTSKTQTHLDRCLTCRNCETTCPSGVEYGHLLDHGRSLVEEQVERPLKQRVMRKAVLSVLPYASRVKPLLKLGQVFKGIMPASLGASIPAKQHSGQWAFDSHTRTMLVLDGCVQPSMAPATNAATSRVLHALGIQLIAAAEAGCCGAVHFHLNEQRDAKDFMRRNIDAWWPAIEAGAECLITTASGCGVMVKDYAHVLADDPDYADKAKRVSALCKDVSEVLRDEDLSQFHDKAASIGPVAFHPPCTLQHGQKLPQITETLLTKLGFTLTPVADSHICCGSAGTYSIFQPEISHQLRDNKVKALIAGKPEIIATANIGCQLHLQAGSGQRVVHWIELIDQLLSDT